MSESIMQTRRECYVCRMKYGVETVKDLEEHHVLNGPLRPVAEQYGLKVYLCHGTTTSRDTVPTLTTSCVCT